MKNLIILCSLIGFSTASHLVYAQDASQLKEMSMQACDAQAAQVPEAQRESMSKICKCTVENTDYDALLKKSASGDASVQTDAIAVAQKCAKENS